MLDVEVAETARAMIDAVLPERTDASLAARMVSMGEVIFGFLNDRLIGNAERIFETGPILPLAFHVDPPRR